MPIEANDKNNTDHVESAVRQPSDGESPSPESVIAKTQTENNQTKPSRIGLVLWGLINFGVIIIIILLAMAGWDRYKNGYTSYEMISGRTAPSPELVNKVEDPSAAEFTNQTSLPINLPYVSQDVAESGIGIRRKALLYTLIPSRPRSDVITYTVQTGDSLFSIADAFGVKPETLLWGNFETLEDNPHLLSKDQVLNILPVDGTYYQWHDGDNLQSIASFFGVETQDILSYSGNNFDLTLASAESPALEDGQWIILPGGKRAIKDWGPPAISRTNPASAKYYGPGHCGSVYEGAYGTGTFIWPTTATHISGYQYSGIHPAIDIGGAIGNAIFASDSGVVVYAGWSNYGYGYMIVIDHGSGWQSAYAHLSAVAVTCGQSVYQGGYIGALGSTGNSSGPHIHFELVYYGAKPNPLDYLQ